MCQITEVEYRSKEKEINFLRLLEQLSRIGLEGSTFICEKVLLSQEMTEINEALLDKIGELKDIVLMVNSKLKSVRTAVELVRSYSENIAKWTSKINELVISDNQTKSMGKRLKVSGYTSNIVTITEDNLVTMMDSLKRKETKVALFMSNKKVEIVRSYFIVVGTDQRDWEQH